MTDNQLDALIEFDTERWTREGVSPALIQQRNIGTRRFYRELESPFAQAAARLASKLNGTAPGTAIDESPLVIDIPPNTCRTCSGTDWLVGDDGKLVPCPMCGAAERIAARRAASVDKYSSGNGRAASQTFDNFVIPDAGKIGIPAAANLKACLVAARRFAANPGGWLIIHGTPGNGKSHLSAAVYGQLKTRSKPTIYSTAPDILKSIQSLFDDETAKAEGTTASQRIATYQTVPVLIVDDLGADHATEWRAATWFEIFDARYRNQLPTMLTMNIAPGDERLGHRLADRLSDTHDGFAAIYHNTAPSYRRM